ncbi:unnamed protein product [Rotaria sordida]|uniref:Uncharacterized protein n=1 Tax=Rotaria sordida TaxID=392033 RepID=A0A814SCU7_9BILA|nr:unnamed protein product [Rotaria sordida]CAF1076369.1 unnamed protein product [Rotaria sordida]CAF1076713.1 unnamed protein product [Rotaria sordida]CAF1109823.1 unnamed protein product [Rotaria sordida]CAF1145735.1 unnamed protein product [Rotaria sordida]
MSSSNFNTISKVLTTGTIIAIVAGSITGLALLIATIVIIICIVKHLNRSRNVAAGGMILQPSQPYSYPSSWSYQYPPNMTSVANYPPPYQSAVPSYTTAAWT